MSLPIPVAEWIQWGQIAQFLRSEEQQNRIAFAGGGPDNFFDLLLSIVVGSVQKQYSNNNNDPNLLITAPYMMSLIGKYQIRARQIINNISGTAPSFTGPSNESTIVGTPVTFSIILTGGTAPVSYQWYRNGIIIVGATGLSYTLSNPQLSDSGAMFSVMASNGAGSTPSNPATLTVTSVITGYFAYMPTDPGPTLRSNSDPFTYQETFSITHNQPLSMTVPPAATPNMYFIVKVPSAESIKTTWMNGQFNSGDIPDAVFQSYLQFGGDTYYYPRTAATLDSTQPLTLS